MLANGEAKYLGRGVEAEAVAVLGIRDIVQQPNEGAAELH